MKTQVRLPGKAGIAMLLLSLVVVVSLIAAACGGTASTSSTGQAPSSSTAISSVTTTAGGTPSSAGSTSSSAASALPADAPEFVIGVDASMSGALAGFGPYEKWAAETAVADQNAQGGVMIDGVAHKLTVVLLDDKSDANAAASNVDTLITKNKAGLILGPVTPTVANPAALAAERRGVPYLQTGTPTEAFSGVTEGQWKTSWNIFASAQDFSAISYAGFKDWGVDSQINHKVALAAVNDADGPLFMAGWKAAAEAEGWQVLELPLFPAGTTDFGSMIQQMKAYGADFIQVLADAPELVALRKQMASIGYKPKAAHLGRGSQLQQFSDSLGDLANGIMLVGYWWPDLKYPGAADLGARFTKESNQTMSQILGPEWATMRVIIDALTKAGTADPTKISDAIGQTNTDSVAGHIQFGTDHNAKLTPIWLQWQNGKLATIWPLDVANAKVIFPLP